MEEDADLNDFLKEAKKIVKEFEDALSWKSSSNKNMVLCPVNKHHNVPAERLKEHSQHCKWRSHGYSMEESREIVEEESVAFPYPCIKTDDIVSKIAPNLPPLRTYEAYVSTLSAEERLQIYDETVKQMRVKRGPKDASLLAELQSKGMEVTQSNQGGAGPKSELEMIKEQRDHKRRRQSYRAKNVHITKRSQTEIFRDVLQVHMEDLRLLWSNESNPDLKQHPSRRDMPSRELSPRHALASRDRLTSRDDRSEKHSRDSRDRSHDRRRSRERSSRESSRRDRDHIDIHDRESYHRKRRHDHDPSFERDRYRQPRDERPADVVGDDVSQSRGVGEHRKKKKHKDKDLKKHSKKHKRKREETDVV